MNEKPIARKAPKTDTELLKAVCNQSDQDAWKAFVNAYDPYVRYVLAGLKSRSLFSLEEDMFGDIAQETFVALAMEFPKRKYNREQSAFHSYLYGIVRNHAIDYLVKVIREKGLETDRRVLVKEEEIRAKNDAALERYQNTNALLRMLVDRVFEGNRWSGKSKEIFLRLTVENAKPRDLAREYGMKENAIYQLKNRVMKKLKELGNILKRNNDDLLDLIEILATKEVFHDPE